MLVKTGSEGAEQWLRTYGGAGNDEIRGVQQTSDGGYVLAGFTSSYGAGGRDAWLVKTDAEGRGVWSKTFGGEGDDAAYCIVQTKDGGHVLAGEGQAWLIKTDKWGNVQGQ